MKDRLKKFIDYLGISVGQFEQQIDIANGAIYKIIQGKNGATLATITKILARFPQLNFDWLLTGRGTMLVKNEKKGAESPQISPAPAAADDKNSPLVEFLTSQLREKDARIEQLAAESALLRAELQKNHSSASASIQTETPISK